MQKQRLIFLAVGLALGLIAVVMVKSYIKDMDENTKKLAAKTLEKMRQSQAAVLIAKQDIPPNTVMQSSMLETAIIPREYIQPQAATSLDSVSGMLTVAPISRGEQISLGKLTSASQMVKKRDLASITPMGKRAVAITPENIGDVIGLLNPGDSVDLIAVVSVPKKKADGKVGIEQTIAPVFQNVLVLAVGQDTDAHSASAKGQKDKTTQITVALDPTEANILTFLQEQGKLRVVSRSGQDSQITAVEPVTWNSVFEHIPALKPVGEPPEPAAVKEPETIDIYRGLNKEKIAISQ